MQFGHFLTILSELDGRSLPGIESHQKMIPKERNIPSMDKIKRSNPKKAGVMALFYPGDQAETHFLLTLRANYPGTHSSQISFPGGKIEKGDKDLAHTALRETCEETGVDPKAITIKKALSEMFIPPSNFLVQPYLGFSHTQPKFKPNHEVEKIIQVRLSDLLNDDAIGIKNLTTSYMKKIDVPCFYFDQNVVWGATAMMLSEIKDLIKLSFH